MSPNPEWLKLVRLAHFLKLTSVEIEFIEEVLADEKSLEN